MILDFRIISIGTLAAHPLWDEKAAVRTGHATTTLISAGNTHILVNPSLPGAALLARLSERTRLRAKDISQVFLTGLNPEHRRGLSEFAHATWHAHESEKHSALADLKDLRREAHAGGDEELVAFIDQDIKLIQNIKPAPDTLTAKVDLFPLPGVTAGTCGLLISQPARTVLICGDAIPSIEHLEQGKVLATSANIEQAQASFKEAIEIADVLVLGRDNVVLNPLRRM